MLGGDESAFGLALALPLLVASFYYLLARPLNCRRCGGQNLGIKVDGYRCRHCGVKFTARNY